MSERRLNISVLPCGRVGGNAVDTEGHGIEARLVAESLQFKFRSVIGLQRMLIV